MLFTNVTMIYVVVGLILTAIFAVVAIIGGAFDLVFMFKELKSKTADEADDGRVI